MKQVLKNSIIHIISMTLILTLNVNINVFALSNNENGDVIDYPWGNEYKDDNKDADDLPLPDNPWNVIISPDTKTNSTQNNSQQQLKNARDAVKTRIISAKRVNKNKKKVRIILKKVRLADGYQIKYSTNKKFKKYKIKTVKSNKFTIKKLKKGKKYYFIARAYGKINNITVYGDWSSRKTLKPKRTTSK